MEGKYFETGIYIITCKFEAQLQNFSCQLLCRKKACLGGKRGDKGFNRRALGCVWRFQYGEVHLRRETVREEQKT